MKQLQGIELRYVLTWHLALHGPATIAEMIDVLTWHGFSVNGRASKAVSDALRWEIERGRVYRVGRGRYRSADIPRSTEYRIHQRVLALRAAAKLSL
jgi:predicted transcriptional regulator of viral defense system